MRGREGGDRREIGSTFMRGRGEECHFVAALQALPARPFGGGRLKIKKKNNTHYGNVRGFISSVCRTAD